MRLVCKACKTEFECPGIPHLYCPGCEDWLCLGEEDADEEDADEDATWDEHEAGS